MAGRPKAEGVLKVIPARFMNREDMRLVMQVLTPRQRGDALIRAWRTIEDGTDLTFEVTGVFDSRSHLQSVGVSVSVADRFAALDRIEANPKDTSAGHFVERCRAFVSAWKLIAEANGVPFNVERRVMDELA